MLEMRGRAQKNNNGTISRPFHTIIHRFKPLFRGHAHLLAQRQFITH